MILETYKYNSYESVITFLNKAPCRVILFLDEHLLGS